MSADGGKRCWDAIEAHPVATLVIDGAGRIVDANPAAETLANRARAAMVGSPCGDIMPWDEPEALARMLAEPTKTAWAYGVPLHVDRAQATHADVAIGPAGAGADWRVMAVHPVPRGGRMPFRRPGSAARSAGAAAAMLAHEVKNPLSGIRGAAQLLGKGNQANAAALSRLICGEVDRIATLIDGMEGFTRDAPLPLGSINIYPAIGQARGIAAQGFAAHLAMAEDFDPSLPRVLANHDALVQILINLIKNAAEAVGGDADRPPALRIVTGYRHGLSWDAGDGRGPRPLPVELAVCDNGPGVPDHLAEALFDPFVSGKRDGQGLGLALVDKLMRDMGGIVQHDRVDGWTRFRLHLPVAPAAGEGG